LHYPRRRAPPSSRRREESTEAAVVHEFITARQNAYVDIVPVNRQANLFRHGPWCGFLGILEQESKRLEGLKKRADFQPKALIGSQKTSADEGA
jgi:hypothetical protein